jgi:tetratricopeptide (TPR) repeat protein
MRYQKSFKITVVFILCVLCFVGSSVADEKGDKIPITTKSKQALESFLKGRDLFEKLQAQESLQYFEKAVAEDANFAMGYLFLSFAQSSAKGFFEQFDKAVALAEKVSEGERLWILGTQAGVNGLPMKQREYYQKMVAAYPNDERAHNLLGNHYFGQQEWEKAIESYNKATKINPDFSQPYNQLGYAYRFLEDYSNAEKAFQKYIELIPNDPNPYDSYAELLMKMGKYEKSVEHYKKALAVNPSFVASHIGIATNLNYLGKYEDARKQLQTLYEMARNDGERRAAYFGMAVSYVDEGSLEKALAEYDKGYALAEKINDAAAMAGDLNNKGNILLEAGKPDKAMAMFEKSVKLIQASDLSQEIKDNANRGFLYNAARAAIRQKDLETAKTKSEKFHQAVKAVNNPLQMMLYHELQGMIALAENDFDKAVAELNQANQQNPYNLFRLAVAYKGKGDGANFKTYCKKAATFNALNSLNQGFIRSKAEEMLAKM